MHLKQLVFMAQVIFILSPAFADSDQLQQNRLKALFEVPVSVPKNYSPHTFIFFIQGAADHYVPKNLDNIDGEWLRADSAEVEKIKKLSLQCPSCNIVLLHIQIGGERWYTASHPWATYLRIYSQNEKLASRHVNVLNAADPNVVSRLIQFSQTLFPKSQFHFIYRGHSFLNAYVPGSSDIKPFDLNFPDSPYGSDQFIQSLEEAHISDRLSSLTFAACSMQDTSFSERLKPYTERVIAVDHEIIECPASHGFSYDFLLSTYRSHTQEEVAEMIAQDIFKKCRMGNT